ncbi:LysR family transcriptional regulator [Lactiplantibacillus garii]|uniref:LysR family transcriptional regulator n=1 Tax=Lactiplantibacillus garii TaxID=2306423 RepID=A0A426D4Y3_9LACO|nr:LysR family transcriptional regulator [Lactiplantibacillus garii]RRK09676.1 LysR family transcriptional regulator [Lactiplantibacillus garii]
MNYSDLKYFVYLVNSGSYIGTAQHFKVTQPAISVAIKRLEKEFQVQLLTQQNRRAPLTTTLPGGVLYLKAKNILTAADKLHDEVTHANDTNIRVGFSTVAGRHWIPRVIKKFQVMNLLDMVHTQERDSDYLIEALRTDKLDAAIFSTLTPYPQKDLTITTLATYDLSLIVNPKHRLATQTVVDVHELRNENFIARPQPTAHQALTSYCQLGNFKPHIIYETPDVELIKQLVKQNVGIALMINSVLDRDDSAIQILSLKAAQQIHCYMQLGLRKNFIPNQNQLKCIDVLKQTSYL